jgi:hypothetical protein
MADMYMIFGSLILLGLSYPAMLIIWWLLFPERVERARLKLLEAPRKSFGLGLAAAVLAALPATIFFRLPSQFTQVLGWIWLVLILGFASIGSAGIAAEIGMRMNLKNDSTSISLGTFLRGATTLELASAFPLIGWLLIIPLGTLVSLGAAVSTLRGNKTKPDTANETA